MSSYQYRDPHVINQTVSRCFQGKRTIFARVSHFYLLFYLRPSSSTNGIFRPSACPSVRLFVCPSVRLSVCLSHLWLCSLHRIIMKFSGVITNDQSKVHAKGQGQKSKVKVTEVTTQLNRFRTVTPVWIHIWWWNDAYSLMLLRRGALLFFNVIRQIIRSRGSKIVKFDPDWAFPDCNSSLNSPMATKWCTKLVVALKRCPIVFEGHLSNFKVTL